ncbi:MAG: hypothetical protein GF417_01615 [Candidatus Latescibacteria bacterium]|nr:hypothetical protein [bacterium]MBD3423124.1 hypothetical protein [Candidatus Latescibacterota bacterium]
MAEPIVGSFYFAIELEGTGWSGGGSGYNGGTWNFYDSGWINQWFYDHPPSIRPGPKS